MTNLTKKSERLELLADEVLKSVHNYCTETFYDGNSVTGEVEVWIGENLLTAKIYINAMVLVPGFEGDFDFAPTADEIDFEIVSIEITSMLNENCVKRTNVLKKLNYMLSEKEGKILNY